MSGGHPRPPEISGISRSFINLGKSDLYIQTCFNWLPFLIYKLNFGVPFVWFSHHTHHHIPSRLTMLCKTVYKEHFSLLINWLRFHLGYRFVAPVLYSTCCACSGRLEISPQSTAEIQKRQGKRKGHGQIEAIGTAGATRWQLHTIFFVSKNIWSRHLELLYLIFH